MMQDNNRRFNLDDYETVEARLEKFWAKFKDGRVETHLISNDNGQYVFVAHLYRTSAIDELSFSTGWAQETIGQGMVNKTSALENCETSAIGRALANANFATSGKRASRSEMEKVVRADAPQTKPAAKPKNAVQASAVVGLPELIALVGLTSDLDKLRELWAEHTNLLDEPFNDTTLRDAIMLRKTALEAGGNE